jgi:hypothetical protein
MSYERDKLRPENLAWKPSLKQERFLALPWEIKEGFYAGAMGAGKSDVLLMYAIVNGWINEPDFKCLYLRRTMPELRTEIIPRSEEYFEPLGAKYNKTDACWKFPSGALYFFGHCENEQDVHKYDSAQWNLVIFDELTSFTEWQYLYITFERVRRSIEQVGRLPAVVRSASNPGNIGHAWVKKRFVDPCPDGGKIIVGRGGNKRIFIPATMADNPHIDPEYAKTVDALPEAERQAKKFGSWTAYEGQVFTEFRAERLLSEPENALHVIKPFDIPEWWPKVVAIDWGYAAMTWVGYGAISPSQKVFIYREQSFQREMIESWAGKVKEWIDRENPRDIVICRSAAQNRGEPHTILEQVSTALGRGVRLFEGGHGSRVSSKALLHEYLRFMPKYTPPSELPEFDNEYAQYLLRNAPIEEYKKYLKIFQPPEPEKNLPKLQIFSHCTLVINAIKSCTYDKTNPEDVAEFPGDDPYDGLRYLIDSVDRYFSDATDSFNKLQAQEHLVKKLEETKDWTTYYREAKRLDNIAFGPKPVSRYHGKQYVH